MYRVYDKEKKCFVKEGVYLAPNTENDLYMMKRTLFGGRVLMPVTKDRYEWNRDIGLYDKENVLIFEEDYLEAQVSDDRIVQGIVTYSNELCSYIILCFDTDEYFTLGESICQYIKVIGNVFEGGKEEESDGNKSL